MADDWLEDDLGGNQPKKKRRLQVDQTGGSSQDRDMNFGTTSRGIFSHTTYYIFSLRLFRFTFLVSRPNGFMAACRFCCSRLLQQGSHLEQEWISEATPGQNDTDAWNGETGQTGGQQVTQPKLDRR